VSRRRLRSLLGVLLLGAVVVVLDQATKIWAHGEFAGRPPVEVVGEFLRFTYVRNPGGAFSIGTDYTWVFSAAALAVSVGIVVYAPRLRSGWWVVALGVLLGGAVGNLVDRASEPPGFGIGYVRDFIQLPYWPVFNVADMAVVGSAGLIIVLSLLGVPATGADRPDGAAGLPEPVGEPDSGVAVPNGPDA
jgi:signal peptidase II